MTKFLTADEATALLKIRRQTLYAYVSRGLIRSNGQEGDPHRRLYRADDVNALLGRKRRGRTPARAAQTALDWGLPVLDSALTLVEDGRLYYCGRDAVKLAESGATLEDVARLMWGAADTDPFATEQAPADALWREAMPRCAAGSAVSRSLTLLPLTASVDTPVWPSDTGRKQIAAAAIVRSVAAALVAGEPDRRLVHETLASAWKLNASGAAIVCAALVLCADHELNASTFTVRCVASTGASLGAAVVAGLAALSGPLHGGSWVRIAALFRDLERAGGPEQGVAEWLQRGEQHLPGFGHPLYPDGDPRTAAILARLKHRPALAEAVAAAGGPPPNLDYALLAMQRELGLPEDAPFIIFAAGRTVGWLAHALEQQATGSLLRPRARYVGLAPNA
ncbi:MAG TPA: citrate synthase family protein [Alphaproteobacteria bacterium]|nr:citrate synthase family protein [Alphaproteobacteria bacterium]